jgi:hypothetical protein
MVDLRAADDSGHSVSQQRLFGVRRAPDMNDDAELLIVPARSVFRKLRVKMPISA